MTEQGDQERSQRNWAAPVESLKVERREGVRGTNVDGRRLHGAIQGFGKLWQKTYTVSGLSVSPEHAIAEWKAHFPEFWPPGNKFAASLTGIQPGEVALLDLAIGGTKLSTGVLVLYADDVSFTFMTPQGHMFGGWITFSAEAGADGMTTVQAQVLMRASDPVYEVALALGGHRKEDVFWRKTLTALARHLGEADPTVAEQLVCVDKRRQWSRWRNVWYNSAIRSVGQTMSGPVRRPENVRKGQVVSGVPGEAEPLPSVQPGQPGQPEPTQEAAASAND
ncbi:MAG TPA: hypothetical protein VKR78_05890 [Acidimicrobiales bacterium]|jgi:hypothetical protein|nr:hypothetical protein [Acidimicrobiales bacterium]